MIRSLNLSPLAWLLCTLLCYGSPTVFGQSLKPSHEADRLLLAAEEALEGQRSQAAADYLTQARQLGINLPADYHFLYGKLLYQQNQSSQARNQLETYVNRSGDNGRFYREALGLITRIAGDPASPTSTPAVSSDAIPQISWSDSHQNYVDKLSQLYQAEPADALTLHANNLLKFYAYGDDRIIAASRMGTPSRHRLMIENADIISYNRLGQEAHATYEQERFQVYGVDPYINYRCTNATRSCWLMHPVTGDRWLQIVQNEEAAEEVARAITNLIRHLQKA